MDIWQNPEEDGWDDDEEEWDDDERAPSQDDRLDLERARNEDSDEED